jgi:hypothetical protein
MFQLQKLLEQIFEQQKIIILNDQTEFVTISCGYVKIQEQLSLSRDAEEPQNISQDICNVTNIRTGHHTKQHCRARGTATAC